VGGAPGGRRGEVRAVPRVELGFALSTGSEIYASWIDR